MQGSKKKIVLAGSFQVKLPFIKMKNLIPKIQKFLKSEDGPTAVEYAIMLALIVAVCLTSIGLVGQNTSAMFNDISTDVEGVVNGTFTGN